MDGVSRDGLGIDRAPGVEEAAASEAPAEIGGLGRDARIASDRERVERAAGLFADLATDPTVALQVAQTWIRDMGADTRESAAVTAEDRGRLQQLLADAQREAERAAREAAANADLFSQVFGWIGAGLAALGGLVGAAFTGGASLALGIAAFALVVGAQVTSELARAGLLEDPDVAMGVTLTCSILATICSLGGASGGTVTNLATTTISIAASCAQAAGGVSDGVAAVYNHDGDIAEVNATLHTIDRDDARAEAEEEVDGLGALLRTFRRLAEHADEARDARAEGLRIATSALRG